MAGDVSIQVGNEVIKPIIEAKIQAALTEALAGDGRQIIEQSVAAILRAKVDSDGKFTNSDYHSVPMMQHLCQKAIRGAAEQAIKEWCETQKPKLIEELKKQLTRKRNSLAELMVLGLEESMKSAWKFQINCNFESKNG